MTQVATISNVFHLIKQVSQSMTSFINSWKINKSCKDNVKTVESLPMADSDSVADECDNLFADRSSELR